MLKLLGIFSQMVFNAENYFTFIPIQVFFGENFAGFKCFLSTSVVV